MSNSDIQKDKNQNQQKHDSKKEKNDSLNSERETKKKNQSAKFKIFMETQAAKPKYTRYFWEKANERPKKDVNTPNIDKYYERLKSTRPKPQHQFKAYELQSNQIPIKLYSAQMKCSVKSPPKKMINIFNESDFYDCKQPKLINHLPESFVTTSFKNYLEKNQERIPDVLNQPFNGKVSTTMEIPQNYEPDFIDPDLDNFEFNDYNS